MCGLLCDHTTDYTCALGCFSNSTSILIHLFMNQMHTFQIGIANIRILEGS